MGLEGMNYIYAWGNNERRKSLKGKPCKVIARLTMNSAIVEFEDGHRECISRNALRKRQK